MPHVYTICKSVIFISLEEMRMALFFSIVWGFSASWLSLKGDNGRILWKFSHSLCA
jgi:hypothetical protein